MTYIDDLTVRPKVSDSSNPIDYAEDWCWIKTDTGAWIGPREEWIKEHVPNIQKYVKKYDIVVQAGGCQGMYPRMLSDMFKHVYTFEPDPLNFHCLVNNCQKDNITKINASLGDRHAMVEVQRMSMHNVGTHSIHFDSEKSTGLVPQLMIDDLKLDNCDLIMLDVEGFEYRVLKGAIKTIEKFKPVIFAENFADNVHNTLSYFGYTHMGTSGADHIYVVA